APRRRGDPRTAREHSGRPARACGISGRRGGRNSVKQYLFTIIFTATITFVCSWAVWQLSLRFKLYPGIRERDVHTTPTPRLGGVAMFLGIAAAIGVSAANPFFSIMWIPPQTMWAVLGAALLIAVIGVIDDLLDLDRKSTRLNSSHV